MWPSIKRWRDWAIHECWPVHHFGPQARSVRLSYRLGGHSISGEPVPWNAEAVSVEAELGIPPSVLRRRGDFQLFVPGMPPIASEGLQRAADREHVRLTFRLPPPGVDAVAEICWRQRPLCRLALPYLGRDEFFDRLQVRCPSLYVRLGDRSVACQTFVATQCRGLMACALLASPTSLLPVADPGLQVEFRSERGSVVQRVPAQLNSSQLTSTHAVVAVVPRRLPRRTGSWRVTWLAGEQPLTTRRAQSVSLRQFHRSLRLLDSRFVVQPQCGKPRHCRQLPPLAELVNAEPTFVLASGEPGMAGICRVRVHRQFAAGGSPEETRQEVLVTDGPTEVRLRSHSADELSRVTGFELRVKEGVLGVLPTNPIPVARFTAEGGFRSSPEFTWGPAVEEDLSERMARLMDDRNAGA